MALCRHVALLRGINVGGNKLIRMADLRAVFQALGFSSVETYIQSGNVVFTTKAARKATLTESIERALEAQFGHEARIVLVTSQELKQVVDEAPAEFGQRPDEFRYDVVFVREPSKPGEVLRQLTPRPGIDAAQAGELALYFRRLSSRASQSRLTKLNRLAVYQNVTVRNWNTTVRLLAMALGNVQGFEGQMEEG